MQCKFYLVLFLCITSFPQTMCSLLHVLRYKLITRNMLSATGLVVHSLLNFVNDTDKVSEAVL